MSRWEPIFGQFSYFLGPTTEICSKLSIYNLKKIANGGSLNGVFWSVTFSIKNNIIYHWTGKFETQKNNKIIDKQDDENEFKIEDHRFSLIKLWFFITRTGCLILIVFYLKIQGV